MADDDTSRGEFRVFLPASGHWLADDENSWTTDFSGTAVFTEFALAHDIAVREDVSLGEFLILRTVTAD